MAALYTNLVYNVIKVAVLLLRVELAFALTTLGAALVEPLLDAVSVENLFAIAALH